MRSLGRIARREGMIIVAVTALFVSSGCESGFRAREAGALGGAGLGAGLGAIIGNQTGHAGAGVAIGSAIGALSGGLIGSQIDAQDDALDASDASIESQDRELAENRRLIDELRSRGADVRDTDRGVVVNLPDVLFEFDSDRLTGSARATVGDVADVVRDLRGRSISVEGHTDSLGTVAYNQRLSEGRARTVAGALVRSGVPRARISTRGFGESRPIASNSGEQGRERNRRVEVIILNSGR